MDRLSLKYTSTEVCVYFHDECIGIADRWRAGRTSRGGDRRVAGGYIAVEGVSQRPVGGGPGGRGGNRLNETGGYVVG